ncbi:MAG TPA: hypothetical protein VKD23_17645 [Terriglobales bacterium]|nr:hypothetical protein [Terriglobales bacterium]
MNLHAVATDHGENGRIAEIVRDSEAESVTVMLGGTNHVRHDKLGCDTFQPG